jgi:hypothetical protein
MRVGVWCLATVAWTCLSAAISGQERPENHAPALDEDDHAIVFELGGAGDWERGEGAIHSGPTLAFEVTPIEHWLELEVGAAAIAAGRRVEMPFDVLFKKPWRISPRFEFMIGIGPEVMHASGRDGGTFWGGEAVLDFMVWPRKNLGWYVEPGYEVVWRDGTPHHGMGMAIGILIGR